MAPGSVKTLILPGAARIYSGKDGRRLATFYGNSSREGFGLNVALIGDVDKDGRRDLLIAAPYESYNAGTVRILSGKDGKAIYTLKGWSLSFFGLTAAGLGDLDGDGHADFCVGALSDFKNKTDPGSVTVFSGKKGTILYKLYGGWGGDYFGAAVSVAGDLDGDGKLDFVVGARQFAPSNMSPQKGKGYVRVFSGKTGKQLHPELLGDNPGDGFGSSVAGIGDINGDGVGDFVVGAPWSSGFVGSNSGYARAFSGKTGKALFTLWGPAGGARFGSAIVSLGDVNLDGTPDFVVRADLPQNKLLITHLVVYSGRKLPLTTDTHQLPLNKAGTQNLNLDAGAAHRNRTYWVFGSATGTRKGINLGTLTVPLDYDIYTTFTLVSPNSTVMPQSRASLNAYGKATVAFRVPSGLPSLKGLTLFHAYLVFDAQNRWVMASNAAPLRLY